jgi:Cys-rich repeat protein
MVLASFGLANKAQAVPRCTSDADCGNGKVCISGVCVKPQYHCHCGSLNYGCDPNQGSFSDCVFYCGSTPYPKGCVP